ncbi:MAG TPA: response regulator [Nitrososphaeraceae archaeon]|nr:response regulator [Nitrososphaeraceae archaeon]
MSNRRDPYEISDGKHVMLMYEDEEHRAQAASYWINRGLEDGQICIYASVHALDQSHMLGIEKLSDRIKQCKENIGNKNLQIINFRPYVESALNGNLSPFEELKNNLEETINDLIVKGKKDKITVFADAACSLCEIKSFDKYEILEKWWQDVHNEWLRNNYHITVICPHPQLVLMNKLDSKSRIMDSHDMLVDLNNYDLHSFLDMHVNEHGMNILIVESDPDLMILYTEFFTKRNINAVVTSESNECLSAIKEKDYDIIILDMHLTGNLNSTDLAKEIYQIRPAQRIVLTTTNPLYRTITGIKSFKVTSEDVLVKPFRLSNLIDVIENKRNS